MADEALRWNPFSDGRPGAFAVGLGLVYHVTAFPADSCLSGLWYASNARDSGKFADMKSAQSFCASLHRTEASQRTLTHKENTDGS
ncbi:hypothetical protein AB3Y40_06620 [Yoonia sp. R2331]|uniref:hypothetical protein n=1 Tax=Yoonia sp. R2331 TaxID=3237238 RepID=UPI0034E3B6C5